MFELAIGAAEDLDGLIAALSRAGTDGETTGRREDAAVREVAADELAADQVAAGEVGVEADAVRVDLLTALERLKAACAAAQARVTADLVASQAQVAARQRQRQQECADAGDFEGWRGARELERGATLTTEATAAAVTTGTSETSATTGRLGRRGRRSAARSVGVAGTVALARRVSPHRGAVCTNLALVLVHELPWVLSVLQTGWLSERRAEIVVTETSHLDPKQRRLVDAELGALGVDEVSGWGDRELARRVRAIAYRIDAQAAMERARYAETERRVTVRPAPDCMTWVTALLPVAQGVAVHAALARDAATASAAGDERSKGQLMADRLVELATGRQVADPTPVEVQVVITDQALLSAGTSGADLAGVDLPGAVRGYGPVPAQWVRDLLTPAPTNPTADPIADPTADPAAQPAAHPATATGTATGTPVGASGGASVGASTGAVATPAGRAAGGASTGTPEAARVWVRRLLTDPVDGSLTAMDSRRRLFDGELRRFLLARDETCRTPWCDAPARHAYHIVPHAAGGPTTISNGQGLCVRCNLTKEQPGWRHHIVQDPDDPDRTHLVEVVTPTGHRHGSHPPPQLPGHHVTPTCRQPHLGDRRPTDFLYRCGDSPLERVICTWLAA